MDGLNMFCLKCGHKIQDEAVFCSKCGAKNEPQRHNPWNQGQYKGYQILTSPKPSAPLPEVIAAESKSVASLVLGIFSIVTSSLAVGVILGPIAIAIGKKARLVLNRSSNNFNIALAGMITGAVGLALSLFILIYWIFISTPKSSPGSVPWSYVLTKGF